ncbi:MAG: hypothetical protein COA78_25085 [Blastopirellula sp.]|nr:MAG: hypothetical protein COA78_25085 [Blastopirellula sp.]
MIQKTLLSKRHHFHHESMLSPLFSTIKSAQCYQKKFSRKAAKEERRNFKHRGTEKTEEWISDYILSIMFIMSEK